ncbi:MAG: hypothetical protein HWD61_04210 [Parachlamydiaceae bacterium]|nr:MAG: hypothetical protein HWD61_04210 [Parachlamydiaceae bacterium]
MKKILLFAVLFAFNGPLFSHEEILDSLAYCYTSLQKEEDQFLSGEQGLYEKLLFVQSTHDVLLDFLNTASEETFYHEMQICKPFIEKMTEVNNQIFLRFIQTAFTIDV